MSETYKVVMRCSNCFQQSTEVIDKGTKANESPGSRCLNCKCIDVRVAVSAA